MESLKKFLTLKTGTERHKRIEELNPTIGFRAEYDNKNFKLHVTVIGARHLPNKIKTLKASGYFIKVTLFPSKEKFNTTTKSESWPKYDEEFKFDLSKDSFSIGSFLVFTVYCTGDHGRCEIAGTITWPLRTEKFCIDRGPVSATQDLWIETSDIRSSLHKNTDDVQNQRERLEVSLCYQEKENEKSVITVALLSLRIGVERARECQSQKAHICVKLGINDGKSWLGTPICKLFPPDISYHWNDFQFDISLDTVAFLHDEWCIRAVVSVKPQYIGKKTVLGMVNITPCNDQYIFSIHEPGVLTKEWYPLKAKKS